MSNGKTLFDKLWESHLITTRDDGASLLYIDRHLLHEGSFFGYRELARRNLLVRRPQQTFAFADHYVPTLNQSAGIAAIANDEIRSMVQSIEDNTARSGVKLFGLGSSSQGIVHVVAPEQGITQPGMTIVCGDSHTSTHGAFGALAFGIGASEVAHVMATQSLWQQKPTAMRVRVDGELPFGVRSKDIVLQLIGMIGTAGATRSVIEFAGETISRLTMEGRMTICNMAIEAGARAGMMAPDDETFRYLENRRYSPKGAHWNEAVDHWRSLASDEGAVFERELSMKAVDLAPMVTWGTSPEHTAPISGAVPNPDDQRDPDQRAYITRAIDYMGLEPGMPLERIKVDRVFIGSCTNARIEDLRDAARLVDGKKTVIAAMVVPGSREIRDQAAREGLDRIFMDAGFEWREPGCSMCLGMNGDLLKPGERCASTSNRNFEGRQGRGGRTHLMSPAMAAAAAVTGYLTDIRKLSSGGGAT
jgi:3-isopropylmalate/(R)-2-methylmalate dehydratase large subunit